MDLWTPGTSNSQRSNIGFREAPPITPNRISFPEPKQVPFYINTNSEIDKILSGKAHLIEWIDGKAVVDRIGYTAAEKFCKYPQQTVEVTSTDGLINFFRDIHPAYHQATKDEHLGFITKVLNPSQRSDLRNTGECELGRGYILRIIGAGIHIKEPHGKTYRNFTLTNVTHLNDYDLVPAEEVVLSPAKFTCKMEYSGLRCTTLTSLGSNARANVLESAQDGYFPMHLIDSRMLKLFYEAIKHPSFRAFTLGDSLDQIISDLVQCYSYIMQDTISPAPYFGKWIWSTDYQPEAAFCACRIWINLDILELTPLAVRVAEHLFGDTFIPKNYQTHITYPYGEIKSCVVSLPTLWALIDQLKLILGRDLGIIEGCWFIPYGKVYPWREWARQIRKALKDFPEHKWLYQMGTTGGRYEKGTKVGEFEYEFLCQALPTEIPCIMGHLFDMTRIITWLGASQSKEVKGIAVDGWVSKAGSPEKIGPVKIGSVTYGPFPISNIPVALYYQFDPIRHDEIPDIDKDDGKFWRPLAEYYKDKDKIEYQVESGMSYREEWKHPERISKPLTRKFSYKPSMGDHEPLSAIEVVGDTLGSEIKGKATHISQIRKKIGDLRDGSPQETDKRRIKYASPI